MPNTSLAAAYSQCSLCANTTTIAFQDENGHVQIGNFTQGAGWAKTQLADSLDPLMGTGLALHPCYTNEGVEQLNLYSQNQAFNWSIALWSPSSLGDKEGSMWSLSLSNLFLSVVQYVLLTHSSEVVTPGWIVNHQVFASIPSGSPIAASVSYTNGSNGFQSWLEVLSVSSKGIQTNTWSGEISDWLELAAYPVAMRNDTDGTDAGKRKSYGDVAVTATGTAFAVVMQEGEADTIEKWQVEDDVVTWDFVGIVNLGGAWG